MRMMLRRRKKMKTSNAAEHKRKRRPSGKAGGEGAYSEDKTCTGGRIKGISETHVRILNKRKVRRFHGLTLILASLIGENQYIKKNRKNSISRA